MEKGIGFQLKNSVLKYQRILGIILVTGVIIGTLFFSIHYIQNETERKIQELLMSNTFDKQQVYAVLEQEQLTTSLIILFLTIVSGFVILFFEKLKTKEKKQKDVKLTSLGELTARISHDLRNPLTVIKGISILNSKSPTSNPDELSRRNLIMNRAINRMTAQIDDILNSVKTQKLDLTDTSLLKCITNAISPMTFSENIKLNMPSNDLIIPADYQKIEIVFANLIKNAIESIGTKSGQIDIEFSESDSDVIISVSDSGEGIPTSDMDKIFESFFTTKQEGTGLGLLSCKTILEQHGGKISVKNNPTTFMITMPKKFKPLHN